MIPFQTGVYISPWRANLILLGLVEYHHELGFPAFRLDRKLYHPLFTVLYFKTVSCVGFTNRRFYPRHISIWLISVVDAISLPLNVLPPHVGSSHSSEHVILGDSNSRRSISRDPSQESITQDMEGGTDRAEYESEGAKDDDKSSAILLNISPAMEDKDTGDSNPVISGVQNGGSFVGGTGSSAVGLGVGGVIQRRGSQTSSLKLLDLEQGYTNRDDQQDKGKYPEDDSDEKSPPPPKTVETLFARTDTSPAPSHHVSSVHLSLGDESLAESEPPPVHLFYAFPERGWFKSIPLAIVGFIIMTLLVVGNLIYTYVPPPPPRTLLMGLIFVV